MKIPSNSNIEHPQDYMLYVLMDPWIELKNEMKLQQELPTRHIWSSYWLIVMNLVV